MHYDLFSRTLAYASCLTSMSLFATSMAIAAVNIGRVPSPVACQGPACVTAHIPAHLQFGGLTNPAHVEAVAAVLWSRKI
jgi:hypothetical protein